MASTTVTVLTPTLAGATITAKGSVASSNTVTIACTTAQGSLDTRSLKIRVENQSSTASVSLSLAASDAFTDAGLGAATVTIATATTVIIGGQYFESARFVNSSDTMVFTQTGTGPTSWEAWQSPRAIE